MNDYYRPSRDQIEDVYSCTKCGHEQFVQYQMSAQMPCPQCGGFVQRTGEAYPGDVSDWNEERNNVNDDWHRRR